MMPTILPHHGVSPTIAEDAFVAPTATIIGDVEIGAQASIWFGCVLRGDINVVRVGPRTNIQDGTVVHVSHVPELGTYIGADITIGHMALVHACRLEDRCFIGMRATVMDGAVVEAAAMVAAGALVTPGKRIPSGQLWAGTPARYVRDLGDDDWVGLGDIALRYAELGQSYRGGAR